MKVADVAPAATVTFAGTLAEVELELDSDTTTPPVGAAAVNVTVPVADCELWIELELIVRLLSAAADSGLTVMPVVALTPE